LKEVIGIPSHEFWNKFFVKWAQNQSLGEKWAATSKRLRTTDLQSVFFNIWFGMVQHQKQVGCREDILVKIYWYYRAEEDNSRIYL